MSNAQHTPELEDKPYSYMTIFPLPRICLASDANAFPVYRKKPLNEKETGPEWVVTYSPSQKLGMVQDEYGEWIKVSVALAAIQKADSLLAALEAAEVALQNATCALETAAYHARGTTMDYLLTEKSKIAAKWGDTRAAIAAAKGGAT